MNKLVQKIKAWFNEYVIDQFVGGTSSITKIKTTLVVAGSLIFVMGSFVWIFFRELSDTGLIVMAVGASSLLLAGVLSWQRVASALFGKQGKYQASTALVLLLVIVFAGVINYLVFFASSRPDPASWLRIDTTAGQSNTLSEQSVNTLKNIKEPVIVTAFFTTNSPESALAWQITEDLLSEFKRRSSIATFDYKRVDPELQPNTAINYGVRGFPALVVELADSRRRDIIYTPTDQDGKIEPFNEKSIITSLLIVNGITQKTVMFITGHGERIISDNEPSGRGWGFAARELFRENYKVLEGTVEELALLLTSPDPNDDPAVVVLAGPTQDISLQESEFLLAYLQNGGSMLVSVEPNTSVFAPNLASLLLNYGLALGEGVVVDLFSSVGVQPTFLQIKSVSGQIPTHPITSNFDVIYLPGVVNLGVIPEAAPDSIPITEDRLPYIDYYPLALTTLESWNETQSDEISFDRGAETPGPLTVVIAINAIAGLNGKPTKQENGTGYIKSQLVVVGDADFASNALIASARNSDLLVNSVNWLADDFELITLRPKFTQPRLLFLTRSELSFIRWSGWLLIPVLVSLLGIWAWWRRR